MWNAEVARRCGMQRWLGGVKIVTIITNTSSTTRVVLNLVSYSSSLA